nr:hypothetical protein [Tanacetum cinerariifolium]
MMEIKAAKPKAKGFTIQEPSEFKTTLSPQPSQAKYKGKGIMVEYEKCLKKKDQISLDENVLPIEERSKLLAELIESRRKNFAAKRAKEIRNKPPTQKMFDKVYKRVNTFVDMNTENVKESLKKNQAEVTEGSSKRVGQELAQGSAKKQKLDEQEQAKVANDYTAELKRCLEIVPKVDDVEIEATPIF